jgi:hypothetical protein
MNPPEDALDRDRLPSERLARLRAAADDELSPEEAAELERSLVERPGDRAIIAFERNLRGAIARLDAGAAPPILRERVRAQLARDNRPRREGVLGRIGVPRWVAVAVSVAIVTALSIALLSRSGDRDAGGIAPPLRAALVAFVGGQQRECELHADLIPERYRIARLAQVPAEFRRILGRAPELGRIDEEGFVLLGAGPCAVPGRGHSVRMVLGVGEARSIVSLYVQKDVGELPLEPGRTYRLADRDAEPDAPTPAIFVWRRDGLVYFLAASSEDAMETARVAFGVPEPAASI